MAEPSEQKVGWISAPHHAPPQGHIFRNNLSARVIFLERFHLTLGPEHVLKQHLLQGLLKARDAFSFVIFIYHNV